jgi:hypothetical protein
MREPMSSSLPTICAPGLPESWCTGQQRRSLGNARRTTAYPIDTDKAGVFTGMDE